MKHGEVILERFVLKNSHAALFRFSWCLDAQRGLLKLADDGLLFVDEAAKHRDLALELFRVLTVANGSILFSRNWRIWPMLDSLSPRALSSRSSRSIVRPGRWLVLANPASELVAL